MNKMAATDLLVLGVGFVGSYILAEAARAGLSAVGVDRQPTTLAGQLGARPRARTRRADLSDLDTTRRILREAKPRSLVITARLSDGDDTPSALTHLIDAAAAAGATQLILISSLAVYGAASAPHGLRETTLPVGPSPYGRSKLAEEREAARAARNAGISCLVLRSCGLIGRLPVPRESNRSAGAIDRVVREYLAGERPILAVEDAPDQYLYARELGAVVVEAVQRPPVAAVMNVGPGHLLEPEDVRHALESALGVSIGLRRCPRTGPAVQVLNVDHLAAWHPQRADVRAELALGLASTVRDFNSRRARSN